MREKRRFSGPVILFVIIAGGGFLLVLMLGGMLIFYQASQSPAVVIVQPSEPPILLSGQGVVLVAEGNSRNGVSRIEFFINDALHSQQNNPKGSEETFKVAFSWFSSPTGIQKLSVIAYDAKGKASEPAALLAAVKPVPVTQLEHRVVDELEGGADYDDAESQPGDGEAESEEGAQQGEELVDEQGQLGVGDAEPDSPGGQVFLGDQNPPLNDDQIGELLDQVDEAEDFPLEFPGHPQNRPPTVFVFSNAARLGDHLEVVGTVHAEDDIGLDYVAVEKFENGIPSDGQRVECIGNTQCDWEYSFSLNAGETRTIIATAFDISGQASEVLKQEYQIIPSEGDDHPAFVVSEDFDANEIQIVNDQAEQREEDVQGRGGGGDDFIDTVTIADYPCAGLEVILGAHYQYVSNNGRQAYITAIAANRGGIVATGWTTVDQGSGDDVLIRMEKNPDSETRQSSDQIQLEFRTVDPNHPDDPFSGEIFYATIVDMDVLWQTPLPDLDIAFASNSGGELQVEIENKGCGLVDGFNLRWLLNGGQQMNRFVDAQIAPETTYAWSEFVPLLNSNLFSLGYLVNVDPDDTIQEIDERNNYYQVRPITLKHVHVYGIDIHNTLEEDDWFEDEREGEFELIIEVGDKRASRPRVVGGLWLLETGYHDIDGFVEPVFLDPTLRWNDDLRILIKAIEDDDGFNSSEICWVEYTHSHDLNQEKNWKSGGEFSETDSGKCTIFWRLVLDE